ncbi:DUF6365 family protein [Clostridiaceae bacterium M8S5]|nr:DUF6365 family protein [Clostridiaceae bacterium M8S5]
MKILFIVTSFWAYGELQIAIDFASQVSTLGHKVIFLVPPSHVDRVKANNIEYRVLIPNCALLNRIILRDIEELFNPDCVILSDFLNYAFCEKHYGLKEEDLSVFTGIIGAFDLYNFSKSGKRVDTYGFRAKEISHLCIDNYDFLLQPCPVNKVALDSSSNYFRYRIFDGIEGRSYTDIKSARETIGVKSSEKLIVMTGAVWQSSFRPYNEVKKLVSAVDDAIMKMIVGLPQNYKVFWIGPRHKPIPEKVTKMRHFESMPPSAFETLVDSADVFVSTNYISTSMIRAALRGVPIVLLANSYLKRTGESRSLTGRRESDILKDLNIVYPFRMFPVGWYSFLETIVNGNSFYKLTRRAEVFYVQEISEVIENAASENLDQTLDNLHKYKEKWLELPSIESIVSSLAQINKTF